MINKKGGMINERRMVSAIALILLLPAMLVMVAGCQKGKAGEGQFEEASGQRTKTGESAEESAVQPETSAGMPGMSIESDIAEIDSLNTELSTDELGDLESELDEVNW